jgi:hypothetical protein
MLMDEQAGNELHDLNEVSKSPLGIRASFEEDKVCLLHGVIQWENRIYVRLIQEMLEQANSVCICCLKSHLPRN